MYTDETKRTAIFPDQLAIYNRQAKQLSGLAGITFALSITQHWYEDAGDYSFSNLASYVIPRTSPRWVHSFDVYAVSRAFDPAGSDAGPLDDWNYNPAYRYTNPSFALAVVNA